MSNDDIAFLTKLEAVIRERRNAAADNSYTKTLFERGTPFIAQKVGEEGVEVAIAAVLGDRSRTVAEAADLVYHLLVLLQASDLTLADVTTELEKRQR